MGGEHPWAPGSFPYQLRISSSSLDGSWGLIALGKIAVKGSPFLSLL